MPFGTTGATEKGNGRRHRIEAKTSEGTCLQVSDACLQARLHPVRTPPSLSPSISVIGQSWRLTASG